ncbi:hypothetical protein LXT12_16865 [Pelomonas sp. P7]|uniref:WD40-like Beta Propeller Repeat n=1 Tax=Pelomonas caseinilytica TaxID=2906763 RepID=A0ABS8XGV1_9BURK|nr:hypothetical protein [Pelomonas sp. P7]MCE4538925.1 hypothetical protein [Pelomonas sp. P7]
MQNILLVALITAPLLAFSSEQVLVPAMVDSTAVPMQGSVPFELAGGKRNVIRLAQSSTGPSTEFSVPTTVANITSVWKLGELVIALGEVVPSRGYQEIDIFDSRTGQLLDAFWGYNMSVSPDRTKVAFVRPFPITGVEGVESQYMLFNLAKPRRDQRELDDRRMNAGEQIYPSVVRPNVNVSPLEAHTLASTLKWSPDGQELVFLDVVSSQVYLTMISPFSSSRGKNITSRRLIPELNKLCMVNASNDCINSPPNQIDLSFRSQEIQIAAASRDQTRNFSVNRAALSPTSD